jgi:hypothetical protein
MKANEISSNGSPQVLNTSHSSRKALLAERSRVQSYPRSGQWTSTQRCLRYERGSSSISWYFSRSRVSSPVSLCMHSGTQATHCLIYLRLVFDLGRPGWPKYITLCSNQQVFALRHKVNYTNLLLSFKHQTLFHRAHLFSGRAIKCL